MKNKRQIVGWIVGVVAIIWMAFIFTESNTPYQKQDIKPLLEDYIHLSKSSHVVEFYYDHDLVTNQDPYVWVEFWIRKAGHVSEYAALTLLIGMALGATTLRKPIKYMLTFAIPFLYACTDEWHQSFVPNRTGHIIDVVTFDLLGIVLALLLYTCNVTFYVRHRKRTKM
jgi:VanZ family protein